MAHSEAYNMFIETPASTTHAALPRLCNPGVGSGGRWGGVAVVGGGGVGCGVWGFLPGRKTKQTGKGPGSAVWGITAAGNGSAMFVRPSGMGMLPRNRAQNAWQRVGQARVRVGARQGAVARAGKV